MNNTTTPHGAGVPDCPHRVCPWYLGYLLVSPIRRILENPEKMLRPFVRPGMTVLEPGCGMGFFSLPIARLVGPAGRVVCVDMQPQMIAGLRRRARRAGVLDRVDTALCTAGDLGVPAWAGRIDIAVAVHVVHEVPNAGHFLGQVFEALRPGGTLVIVEPKGHVTPSQFEGTLAAAEAVGFRRGVAPTEGKRLQAVLSRP